MALCVFWQWNKTWFICLKKRRIWHALGILESTLKTFGIEDFNIYYTTPFISNRTDQIWSGLWEIVWKRPPNSSSSLTKTAMWNKQVLNDLYSSPFVFGVSWSLLPVVLHDAEFMVHMWCSVVVETSPDINSENNNNKIIYWNVTQGWKLYELLEGLRFCRYTGNRIKSKEDNCKYMLGEQPLMEMDIFVVRYLGFFLFLFSFSPRQLNHI